MALRNAPAGFGYFRPVESTIKCALCPQAGFDNPPMRVFPGRCIILAKSRLRRLTSKRACGQFWGAAPPFPRVTFHRGKVTKARRGPSPKGQEAPGPLSAQKTRQTGPASGYHGAAMWGEKHPFAARRQVLI